ncbi:MAG: hypothetical protein KY455_11255 [Euryarchaeota archaeon]|nr:hypothetical protein [Euryarchaeota archaeon]
MAVRGGPDRHKRFQYTIAIIFMAAALAVGAFMAWGPDPPTRDARLAQFFFIEMPLFIILALVGMNALVRAGMGSKKR